MSDMLFAIKTLIFSMILVSLMQIRVSGVPVESHMQQWLATSKVAHFIQGAAVGAVYATRDLHRTINDLVKGNSSKAQKNERASR